MPLDRHQIYLYAWDAQADDRRARHHADRLPNPSCRRRIAQRHAAARRLRGARPAYTSATLETRRRWRHAHIRILGRGPPPTRRRGVPERKHARGARGADAAAKREVGGAYHHTRPRSCFITIFRLTTDCPKSPVQRAPRGCAKGWLARKSPALIHCLLLVYVIAHTNSGVIAPLRVTRGQPRRYADGTNEGVSSKNLEPVATAAPGSTSRLAGQSEHSGCVVPYRQPLW